MEVRSDLMPCFMGSKEHHKIVPSKSRLFYRPSLRNTNELEGEKVKSHESRDGQNGKRTEQLVLLI